MNIPVLIQKITDSKGWISGSYVRDVMVRGDPDYVLRDLDVLIPFRLHENLVRTLVLEFSFDDEKIDYNESEEIAHTHLIFDGLIVDIFSSEEYEYLSPPEADVSTLCWDGVKYQTWYPFEYSEDEAYGQSFDVDSIVGRALRKEAVALIADWIHDGDYERFYKLVNMGWTFLNYEETIEFLKDGDA